MFLALYVTLGYFTLIFIGATILKNNSIVDIGWGFGFVLTSWILYAIFGNYTLSSLIVNLMVSLWGLRLFYYILKRNIFHKEDFRYANWRKQWGKWVVPRAFIQVFMLQGMLQFMIGSVPYYLNINTTRMNYISLIGVVVWIIGYFFQVVGDTQLKRYLSVKKREPLMKTGLWSVTRHPNYFGESLMWWGIYIYGVLNGVPWYLVISPLTITVVLYFISTPLLEKRMKKRKGWNTYAKQTPMFFPFVGGRR